MKLERSTREIHIWATVVWIECYGFDFRNLQLGLEKVEREFELVDQIFSTFKEDSEVALFNSNKVAFENSSTSFKEIWKLCETSKFLTEGAFDPWIGGQFDPLGVIKGWAADRAVEILKNFGATSIQVNAAGDVSLFGGYPEGGSKIGRAHV